METEFWHQRWQDNQIGFHQEKINSRLIRLWPDLGLRAGDLVFVPLCGKSLDMLWLAQQGYRVFGVELSEIACEAFFRDNQLDYSVSEQGPFTVYTGDAIALWAGDFFALTEKDMHSVAATYDRAALVALPEAMREEYCRHLARILPQGSPTLLISMEYDQQKMKGPPFSVVEDEITRNLSGNFSVEKLSQSSGPDIVGNLARRGLDTLTEKIFKLVRVPSERALTTSAEPVNPAEASCSSDDGDIAEHGDQGVFSATEARILACLMEKELTVPDSYPLTINSLVLACNQKSNREPVMKLTEGEVGHVARSLANRGYIRIQDSERARRVGHCMRQEFSLDKAEQALLAVMMLRAPQTLNELKTRTGRMAEFSDIDDVLLTLELLNEKPVKLMRHLPKGPGQREDRYTHLLCGTPSVAAPTRKPPDKHQEPISQPADVIEQLTRRIDELERRITLLEQRS